MSITDVKEVIGKNGREEADLSWKTEDGQMITQRCWNQENCWFWLNKLVLATGADIPDGEEFDLLNKRGEFGRFLRMLLDLPAVVVVRKETFEGSDGTQKSNFKVKDVKPVPAAPGGNDVDI
jgi:hypothetical protein